MKQFFLAIGCVFLFSLLALPGTTRAANPFVDITFPIAELGNCGSLHECKVYCDDPSHQDACIAFAKANGLSTGEPQETQSPQASSIESILKNGGPGGCTTEDACRSYCEDITHIDECLAFGKAHHLLSDDQLQEAEKISTVLKNGVTLPGGCTSRESCEAYCSQELHREECMGFGEKTGLGGPQGQNGQGQGTFGETGTTGERLIGPGGCTSAETCAAFCNDPANQKTCIAFAQAHGFIKKDDAEGATQSLTNIAAGISHAPPEVQRCLEGILGSGGFASLQSGTAPSLDQITQVKTCFQSAQSQIQAKFKEQFTGDSGIKNCITGAVGADAVQQVEAGQGPPDPATAQKMRQCFEQHYAPQGDSHNQPGANSSGSGNPPEQSDSQGQPPNGGNFVPGDTNTKTNEFPLSGGGDQGQTQGQFYGPMPGEKPGTTYYGNMPPSGNTGGSPNGTYPLPPGSTGSEPKHVPSPSSYPQGSYPNTYPNTGGEIPGYPQPSGTYGPPPSSAPFTPPQGGALTPPPPASSPAPSPTSFKFKDALHAVLPANVFNAIGAFFKSLGF